jgi:hypothetical protein
MVSLVEPFTKEGEFLPFVSDPERSLTRRVKGGKEGFSLLCLHNYGLTNNNPERCPGRRDLETSLTFVRPGFRMIIKGK